MDVRLTPDTERLVRAKLQSGRYGSANDVILEALRLMDERDERQALRQNGVQAKIAAGLASLRAGQGVDGETFLMALDDDLAELERNALT